MIGEFSTSTPALSVNFYHPLTSSIDIACVVVYTAQSSVIPIVFLISSKFKFFRLHFKTFAELGKLKVRFHFK